MTTIYGAIDQQGRCRHYHGERDIVAIKFKCCGRYFGCFYCHEQAMDHPAEVWQKQDLHTMAILCGNCRTELTIEQYLNGGYTCPSCQARFNPKCSNHYPLYFAPSLYHSDDCEFQSEE